MVPKQCPVCGAVAPLHRVHVTPKALAGGRDDFVFMCANCDIQLSNKTFRELEFEIVLADLMQWSGEFTSVTVEPRLKNAAGEVRRPDIVAEASGTTFVVECRGAQVVGPGRLRDAVAQLKEYGDGTSTRQLVLALPARLAAVERQALEQQGVHVWDLDVIAKRFRQHLDGVTHPVLRPLLLATAALADPNAPNSPEAHLLAELRAVQPGRSSWSEYQKLTGRILERLFCPPLSTPIIERSDASGTNRRDIILPNYAEAGFWRFLRERYQADFLVVDAKNYSERIGKSEALQLLNYLKVHGSGNFGIIVTRHGHDDGCALTMKEHWTLHQKLVLVLTDEHIESMLRAKEAGASPEDIIRQLLEEFRLSI